MISEKDLRAYYRKKIKIVLTLDEKWREIGASPPARAVKGVPAAEDLSRQLDDIDRQYHQEFGEKAFRDALRTASSDDLAEARSRLRQILVEATETLKQTTSRLEDLKTDLGRRLSALRSRPRLSRHGRFDRNA